MDLKMQVFTVNVDGLCESLVAASGTCMMRHPDCA